MNLPASAEQVAWLAAKLPVHTEWQVWRCAKRRGGKMTWTLSERRSDEDNARALAARFNESGDVTSVLKVIVNRVEP